ncbi:hypothetical protein [Burkholderia metallica]|uniref:hypothetical protein n=1 Tax=Burkholderia metallica TaxID=488729 RepID=UPI00131C7887|nr:hypothetical protein [Burkholderia metallica]
MTEGEGMQPRRADATDRFHVRVVLAMRVMTSRNTKQITLLCGLRIAFVDAGNVVFDVRRGTATHAASRGTSRGLLSDDAY